MKNDIMASVEEELRQMIGRTPSFSTLKNRIDKMRDEHGDGSPLVMEKIALYGIILCWDEFKKSGHLYPALSEFFRDLYPPLADLGDGGKGVVYL